MDEELLTIIVCLVIVPITSFIILYLVSFLESKHAAKIAKEAQAARQAIEQRQKAQEGLVKQRKAQEEEAKRIAQTKKEYRILCNKLRKHERLVKKCRLEYIQQIDNVIKEYLNILMAKYDQLTYTDEYGLLVEDDFLKEFYNNFIPRVLEPKLQDPTKQSRLRSSYKEISGLVSDYKNRLTGSLACQKFYASHPINNTNFSLDEYSFFDFDIDYAEEIEFADLLLPLTIVENRSFCGLKDFASYLFFYEKGLVDDSNKQVDKKHNGLTPLDYEKYIAGSLKGLGFETRATKASGDQGADVIAKKNNVSFAIQCKMYSSPVGNKAVQEANAGRDFYKCEHGVVVSNASFTKAAKQAANACGIILLNDGNLDKLLKYTE